MRKPIAALGQLAIFMALLEQALAQNATPEQFFESRIRPLLVNHCYVCHTDAESGGLRLDSPERALKGGKSGPPIVPGHPEQSLLIRAVTYTDERLKMPPTGKLDEEDIGDLTGWVKAGAIWPAAGPPPAGYRITPQQQAFWSFQPLGKNAPPAVGQTPGPKNPVDAFILAKLEEKKLKPGRTASRRTLIRRASYDLTGLPPTPAEIDAFLSDKSPDAFAKVVDRLLASPEYGERWGRHWLDLVRYADTAGDSADYPVPQAYLYRDYAIRAFNRDKPYDQFLREQIAGDLLPASSDDEYWEHVIATGYLAIARRFSVEPEQNMNLTIDDTIDNVGRTVLGLSVACARCHDHKYDPIPSRDYYAWYGIFDSTRYPFAGSEKDHEPKYFTTRVPRAEADAILKSYREKIEPLNQRIDKVDAERRAFVPGQNPNRTMETILAELEDLKARRAPILETMPKLEMAYAVSEGTGHDVRIQKRGDPKNLGDVAPRAFLQILGGRPLSDAKASGRLELAKWLVDPANPLTARVMVNRIWQYHFGRGLVATPSDFGKRGLPPTHPELLDFLARRFMESGWSIKAMHRLMMLSDTYQLASDGDEQNALIDAGDEFLWKFHRNRLDAEEIRDSLLLISGHLERGPGGAHPFPHVDTWDFMQHGPFTAVYQTDRRSVYLMTQRIQKHPYLSIFDGVDANLSTPDRAVTITPVQALFAMNSQFVHECAYTWAGLLLQETPSDRQRIERAYLIALGRPASPEELLKADQYLRQASTALQAAGVTSAELPRKALASFLRPLLGSNEFMFVD